MEKDQNTEICNWCGQATSLIWVHGHGQCKKCGTNIDECCRGENKNIHEQKDNH